MELPSGLLIHISANRHSKSGNLLTFDLLVSLSLEFNLRPVEIKITMMESTIKSALGDTAKTGCVCLSNGVYNTKIL